MKDVNESKYKKPPNLLDRNNSAKNPPRKKKKDNTKPIANTDPPNIEHEINPWNACFPNPLCAAYLNGKSRPQPFPLRNLRNLVRLRDVSLWSVERSVHSGTWKKTDSKTTMFEATRQSRARGGPNTARENM